MDPTATDVLSLLEVLDDEIDDLEDSLAPILDAGLADTASKLPLLDKAKMYILVTYAVESILFSYLRLNGVNAREHPVFKELTRVKQYFDKLKAAENPTLRQPGLTLNKNAAGRFIKAGLTGNDKIDLERAERLAKEKARTHIRFNNEEPKKVVPAAVKPALPPSDPSSSDGESPEAVQKPTAQASKKRKADTLASELSSESKKTTSPSAAGPSKSARKKKSKNTKVEKKAKQAKKN